MRILVTGVTGQIGSALLQSLSPYGTIIAADRGLLDLTKPRELPSGIAALSPNVIINAAAYTQVDQAENDIETAFRVNGESPAIMARFAAERRIPFVHISTDYVFDGSGSRPWLEDDPTGPLNVYGASKLAGEHGVEDAGGSHLIVRTSWIYSSRRTNFLRTIAQLAAERDELRIVADQIGAPTSAAWVAEVIAAIFARERSNLPIAFSNSAHKVNIAAAGETSWHGFAHAIIDGLRQRGRTVRVCSVIPITSDTYSASAKRPKNSRLDLSRLMRVFQIKSIAWNVLLERELDVFVQNID
jgi:dTDP-4-dehydrorhamnose reductase